MLVLLKKSIFSSNLYPVEEKLIEKFGKETGELAITKLRKIIDGTYIEENNSYTS